MLVEYVLYVPADGAFAAARRPCYVSDGIALGQQDRHFALCRRETEDLCYKAPVDARPARRLDDQRERGDASGTNIQLPVGHGTQVQHSCGKPSKRLTIIDPLSP